MKHDHRPDWKSKKIKTNCMICGKELLNYPSDMKNGKGKFCSRECVNIGQSKFKTGINASHWQGGRIEKQCLVCGNKFNFDKHRLLSNRGRFCSQSCTAIWRIKHGKTKGTSIEIKMEQELTRLGIVFQKQYPIWQAKTIPDFFISPNICIYCDGDYWHRIKGMPEKDAQQNFMLNFLGYNVYRFWEKDIKNNIQKCVTKIKEIRNETYRG